VILRSRLFRHLITRLARAYGFLDPVALLGNMRGFAKPSEVAEPIELLRAGMLFHARGLLNTKAIQNNLDWVWPYWVERQFNPSDPSFIPRAFSFSHINLTHRNWTAVGLPDIPFYPLVDPRGLVTPLFDGWSLDFWFVPDQGPILLPSKLEGFEQQLTLLPTSDSGSNLQVRSVAAAASITLESLVSMEIVAGAPQCRVRIRAHRASAGSIAVALRPYNPEGVAQIKSVTVTADGRGWRVNGENDIAFDRPPARHLLSNYDAGDVLLRLDQGADESPVEEAAVTCSVSMATAVALFPCGHPGDTPLEIRVPIDDELDARHRPEFKSAVTWSDALAPLARLSIPAGDVQRLYDVARANLVLFSPREVYPGPYTYKRFWFRDAVFILNAVLSLGGVERTRRALDGFAPRQRRDGYFLSQDGEWDSNGEALWFFQRFAALTGEPLPKEWLAAVAKGARWISRKRLPRQPPRLEAGLLPAGFSAEHLGPNDFYYWDDFWAVAGLRAAGTLLHASEPGLAGACAAEADEFLATIRASFPAGPNRAFPGTIPAAPHRRMDSGAVGSLVADYPLQLFEPNEPWIARTTDYLCAHHLHHGGFFQNMIHSGINAYLTLHLAQVRLRAGDADAAWALMDRVSALASSTGQWPEAIHPLTGGGCMGDGQHIWAAAEWVMLVRNLFVREEGDLLVIGSGVRPAWWGAPEAAGEIYFGPTLTAHGAVTVRLAAQAGGLCLRVDGEWRAGAPRRELQVPGCTPLSVAAGDAATEFILPLHP